MGRPDLAPGDDNHDQNLDVQALAASPGDAVPDTEPAPDFVGVDGAMAEARELLLSQRRSRAAMVTAPVCARCGGSGYVKHARHLSMVGYDPCPSCAIAGASER